MPFFASSANAQETPQPFSFDVVIAAAREAAGRQFERPALDLAAPFANLTYDQFRAIRFRDERRFFTEAGEAFQMDLLPPGFYFQDRINVNVVSGGVVQPIQFSPDFFHFHPNYFPYPDGTAPSDLQGDMGFTGLRFRHPINNPGVWDEVMVFQGASYFRAVARDTLYGLSARGLAIGTGGADPEEFPLFTQFWVEEPVEGSTVLRISALLDSPSVAGAYEFTATPGEETEIAVRSVLFPRQDIRFVGVAPLTSMYFFGPERRAGVDDFRDAVHDSEALAIENGSGEHLWRPLSNPSTVQTSAFGDNNPRRFGLIQRHRDFGHFQDAEAHYEQRPSAWIEPEGEWGPGSVMLVEIPTSDEFTDNIVSFWRPAAPLEGGSEHRFDYRLTFGQDLPDDAPLARILATRSGLSILDANERVFVIDFDLGSVNFEGLNAKIGSSAGEVKGLSLSPLPEGNGARVGFHFVAGEANMSEFRLSLEGPGGRVSEVWLYRWTRPSA